MILLSALLASLTGLVSGERPVERAQVESSAVAAIARAGAAVQAMALRPVQPLAHPASLPSPVARFDRPAPVRAPFTLPAEKQSWLE